MAHPAGTGLDRYLAAARERIDAALDDAVPSLGVGPAVLHHAVRHALLAPGKRLRGAVVLAACETCRGPEPVALRFACAVELVHAASLVLDDLPSMDDATLRRGRPTLHREHGEANAILAAVAMLTLGFDVVRAAAGVRERVRNEAVGVLATAIGAEGLVGGQVADLEATGTRLDLETLEYIHSHKTGALFIAAAELGGIAAAARRRDRDALRAWAKNLGLAFQITDDLLDYSGDPATTGKDAGLDRDKTTFVDLCGIEGSRRLVDELIDTSVAALAPVGRRAARLRELAEFVRGRDR